MSEKFNKPSHKEWRKTAKKMRRKCHRQKEAKERDDILAKENAANLSNPSYLSWLAEQRALELLKEELEEHLRSETQKQWQEYDHLVQQRWKIQQEKLAKIEEAKQQEKLRICAEFEANKERLRLLKEEKIRLAEEKLKQHEKLSLAIEKYITGAGDLPVELNVIAESNPGKTICPFFEKTSTCRYGIKCSRNHCRPGISRLLLIPNFFSHIRLDQSKHTEYGSDFSLEIDDAELNRDFDYFFSDIEPEITRLGKINNFCVCSNQEPHLRGHVYVEFEDQRNALKAYRHLQGRYYAGRMLNVEFSKMISWRSAVCGLSFANKCPKGRNCNFLHIFKNPRNRYPLFDQNRSNVTHQRLSTTRRMSLDRRRDVEKNDNTNWDDCDDNNSSSTKRNWRWSESPEIESSTVRRSTTRSRSQKRCDRDEGTRKSIKSHSRSNNKRNSEHFSRHCDRAERRESKESKRCRKTDDEDKEKSNRKSRDSKREKRSCTKSSSLDHSSRSKRTSKKMGH